MGEPPRWGCGYVISWSYLTDTYVATTPGFPRSGRGPDPMDALAALLEMIEEDTMARAPEGTRTDEQGPRDSDRKAKAAGEKNHEGVPKRK